MKRKIFPSLIFVIIFSLLLDMIPPFTPVTAASFSAVPAESLVWQKESTDDFLDHGFVANGVYVNLADKTVVFAYADYRHIYDAG